MGSLRLPAAQVARLGPLAKRAGLTLPELIRRTLAGVLEAPEALADVKSPAVRVTARLGLLRLQPELAERLNVVAQELGVSVAEVVRRAMELGTRPSV